MVTYTFQRRATSPSSAGPQLIEVTAPTYKVAEELLSDEVAPRDYTLIEAVWKE